MTEAPNPLTPRGRFSLVYRRWLHQQGGGRCQYCGKPVSLVGCEIDHVVAKSLGGEDRHPNLRLACGACNAAKRDRTVEEFRANCAARATLACEVISPRQVWLLESLGYDMGLKPFLFHFEKVATA